MPINEIQVGRFNSILRKLMGMDVAAPTPSLATDLFPTVALEVERPEWSFLSGERRCTMRWSDAAVAANYSAVGLRNPSGSGVLCVVERIIVFASAATVIQFGLRANGTVDASNLPGIVIDTRWWDNAPSTKGACVMVERTQATAPVYPAYEVAVGAINTPQVVTVPWVISPGWELIIYNSTVNMYARAAIYWRERILEASETR